MTEIVTDVNELTGMANKLDVKIRQEWQESERSMVRLAGLLSKMREKALWSYLIDIRTRCKHCDKLKSASVQQARGNQCTCVEPEFATGNKPYRRFSEYVSAITGSGMAHTKLYDMLAIYGLTQGEDALDPKDVEEMGPKNAAEVARLEPGDRTPDVIEAAKKESTRKVKKIVQEKLNEKLDPEERKDPTFMFARNLDEPTIELIEQIEKDGIWIEAVRNGDKSVSQLVKLWNYVWAKFVLDYQEELEEGRRYREAQDAAKAQEIENVGSEDEPETASLDLPDPDEHEATLQAMGREDYGH